MKIKSILNSTFIRLIIILTFSFIFILFSHELKRKITLLILTNKSFQNYLDKYGIIIGLNLFYYLSTFFLSFLFLYFYNLFLLKNKEYTKILRSLFFKRNFIKEFLKGVIFIAVLFFSTIFVSIYWINKINIYSFFSNTVLETWFKYYLISDLIFSIMEELIYRGVVYNGFKPVINKTPAFILSSLVFVFIHTYEKAVLIYMVRNFVFSILFLYLLEKRQNLWFDIGIHFAFNSLSQFLFKNIDSSVFAIGFSVVCLLYILLDFILSNKIGRNLSLELSNG